MKDQLIFDTTDAGTILDSDNVGAYVRSSDGTLITHTSENGDQALDVHISNTSIVVTATDLDIRNLDFNNDSVTAYQGTDPWIIGDGGGSITVDGSVTVSATDLDIRNLVHTQDSVRLGDGTSFFTSTTVGADLGLDVYQLNDPATANTAIATAVNTLDTANTAEDVVASPLANRKTLFIYNNDNRKIYIGQSGVSAANGFPLSPGSYIELKAGPSVDIEWVTSTAGHDIRTLELA